jgi:hypothetical protein
MDLEEIQILNCVSLDIFSQLLISELMANTELSNSIGFPLHKNTLHALSAR